MNAPATPDPLEANFLKDDQFTDLRDAGVELVTETVFHGGHRYEGRMGSTLLMETPEGLVISGDVCPRANTRGVISDLGYNLGWFAGTSSADYLASKFLEKGWHAKLAQRDMEVSLHRSVSTSRPGGIR